MLLLLALREKAETVRILSTVPQEVAGLGVTLGYGCVACPFHLFCSIDWGEKIHSADVD